MSGIGETIQKTSRHGFPSVRRKPSSSRSRNRIDWSTIRKMDSAWCTTTKTPHWNHHKDMQYKVTLENVPVGS